MDEPVVDTALASSSSESILATLTGLQVVPFDAVVHRLRLAYPGVAPARIESILLREWEAFTAGRPLVVPVAVEVGVREILDEQAARS